MSEDLLDYWVRLIKPSFPINAWIVARCSGEDHIIEIDWKLDDDLNRGRPNRRSRKIQITISDGAIEEYLGKNKHERGLSDIHLTKLIRARYDPAHPGQPIHPGSAASMDRLLIARDMLNP
jgi:hypothetical protein